jgi:hypothetical protein
MIALVVIIHRLPAMPCIVLERSFDTSGVDIALLRAVFCAEAVLLRPCASASCTLTARRVQVQ